jgi:hypothetical protein
MEAQGILSPAAPCAVAPPPRGSRRRLRRLRVLLYLLLTLTAIDLVVWSQRATWEASSPDGYNERLAGCRRRPRDLILLGGSPVTEGFDPQILAGVVWRGRELADVYSLGMSGGTTTDFWHALHHGLAAPPRLLVYGVCASDLNDSRNEPHGPWSLMNWSDLVTWYHTKPRSAEWVTRHFVQGCFSRCWQVYRYRNGLRVWAGQRIEQLWPGSFTATAREAQAQQAYSAALCSDTGFAPNPAFRYSRYDQMKAQEGSADQLPILKNFRRFGYLDGYRLGDHLKYLHRILDWAEDHGVGVVLVDMPVTADLEDLYYPDAFKQFRAALGDIERSRGVRVLRPNRAEVGLTDAQFADLIHLNGDGCTRLSGWLRQQLADHPEAAQ